MTCSWSWLLRIEDETILASQETVLGIGHMWPPGNLRYGCFPRTGSYGNRVTSNGRYGCGRRSTVFVALCLRELRAHKRPGPRFSRPSEVHNRSRRLCALTASSLEIKCLHSVVRTSSFFSRPHVAALLAMCAESAHYEAGRRAGNRIGSESCRCCNTIGHMWPIRARQFRRMRPIWRFHPSVRNVCAPCTRDGSSDSRRSQPNGTGFYGSSCSHNGRGCYGRTDPKSADGHKCRQLLTGRG